MRYNPLDLAKLDLGTTNEMLDPNTAGKTNAEIQLAKHLCPRSTLAGLRIDVILALNDNDPAVKAFQQIRMVTRILANEHSRTESFFSRIPAEICRRIAVLTGANSSLPEKIAETTAIDYFKLR